MGSSLCRLLSTSVSVSVSVDEVVYPDLSSAVSGAWWYAVRVPGALRRCGGGH